MRALIYNVVILNIKLQRCKINSVSSKQDGRRKPRPGVEAQREAIREAAAELFLEQGSQAVSISQICQRTHISRPTFYRCFEDKDALVNSLYQQSIFSPIQDILLSRLPQQGSDPTWLRETLDATLDAIFDQARFAELVFAESNNPGSPAHRIVNQAFDQTAEIVAMWLQHSGHPVLPKAFLKSVMAACQWLVHNAMRSGLSDASRTEAKEATWLLVSSLLAGLPRAS